MQEQTAFVTNLFQAAAWIGSALSPLSSWLEELVFVRVEQDITATTPLFYYDHLRFVTPFYDDVCAVTTSARMVVRASCARSSTRGMRTAMPSIRPRSLLPSSKSYPYELPGRGLVGDWFAGSGAVGEACRLTGRRYLGCEIDAAMAERARARIAAVLPFHAEGGA